MFVAGLSGFFVCFLRPTIDVHGDSVHLEKSVIAKLIPEVLRFQLISVKILVHAFELGSRGNRLARSWKINQNIFITKLFLS